MFKYFKEKEKKKKNLLKNMKKCVKFPKFINIYICFSYDFELYIIYIFSDPQTIPTILSLPLRSEYYCPVQTSV
tara:strand:+ start:116 stop:337 length:222 start_codon:yes stop_codon:yes gene_type:complete